MPQKKATPSLCPWVFVCYRYGSRLARRQEHWLKPRKNPCTHKPCKPNPRGDVDRGQVRSLAVFVNRLAKAGKWAELGHFSTPKLGIVSKRCSGRFLYAFIRATPMLTAFPPTCWAVSWRSSVGRPWRISCTRPCKEHSSGKWKISVVQSAGLIAGGLSFMFDMYLKALLAEIFASCSTGIRE